MNFVCDAHCHPADPLLRGRIDEIISESVKAGLTFIVGVSERCSSIDSFWYIDEDSVALLDLSKRYPQILPCIGLHPWYVHEESLDAMIQLIEDNHDRLAGIGEIGVDFAQRILSQSPVILFAIVSIV